MATIKSIQKPRANMIPIPLMLGIGGIAAAAIIGLMAAATPTFTILGIVALIIIVASLQYPEAATLTFFFILYTNSALIAANFHNVPIAIAGLFPLIMMLPFAIYMLFGKEKIILTPQLYLLAGLLLVQVVGTINSIDVGTASEELFEFIVEGVIIYFLVTNVVRTPATLKRVMLVILIAAIILGAFPLFQELTKTYDNNYGGFAQIEEYAGFTAQETLISEVRQQRLSGAIGEVNRFAQTMLMMLMISLPMLGGRTSLPWKLIALAASVFSVAGVILPFSRGAAVGFALLVIIAVPLRLIDVRRVAVFVMLGVVALMAVPQYAARIVSIQDSFEYVAGDSSSGEADGATKGRLTEMLAAVIVYVEHPVVGVGPGMYKYYSQDVGNQLGIRRLDGARRSHSLYLDIAANTGTLGLLTTLGAVFVTVRQLIRVRNRWERGNPFLRNVATGLALAIIVYMTTGFFLHFAYIRYFWTTIALGAATAQISKQVAESITDDPALATAATAATAAHP
ncbi:MAG: O-antigen ligase family protein [Anaerolineae bacterium]|nr:O-antigen ligase family protein [Anaerolineae bacterium]